MNRYRIVGAIAFIWGAALLLSYLLGFRRIEGSGAYSAGQYAGLIFGGILLVAGLYALLVSGKKKKL